MEKIKESQSHQLLPNVLFFFLYHKPNERKKVQWLLVFLLISNILLLSPTLLMLSVVFLLLGSRWYVFHLICHYVLDENELVIRGINISFIKDVYNRAFKWFIWGGVIPFLILFPLILIYLVIHNPVEADMLGAIVGFALSLLLGIYQCILFNFIEKYVMSTVISEGLQANVDLQNFSFNSLYSDFREIIIKKIIT